MERERSRTNSSDAPPPYVPDFNGTGSNLPLESSTQPFLYSQDPHGFGTPPTVGQQELSWPTNNAYSVDPHLTTQANALSLNPKGDVVVEIQPPKKETTLVVEAPQYSANNQLFKIWLLDGSYKV